MQRNMDMDMESASLGPPTCHKRPPTVHFFDTHSLLSFTNICGRPTDALRPAGAGAVPTRP